MIYFKKDLNEKALKELHDFVDLANDYQKIDNVLNAEWASEVLMYAAQLDNELRSKYKTINLMLDVASILPKRNAPIASGSSSYTPAEISRLIQDRYGILADVLLKKCIIKTVKEFIDYVD